MDMYCFDGGCFLVATILSFATADEFVREYAWMKFDTKENVKLKLKQIYKEVSRANNQIVKVETKPVRCDIPRSGRAKKTRNGIS